jgi:chorismate dehydratase
MDQPRISASSYSNTAPLVWSFLYGRNHGKVELVLDNAPARSAELLTAGRVDAALVPVIASQTIEGVRIVPGICVGARKKVRSVCLVTKGDDLKNVRSVALDTSSRTSVALTKIIFREFLGIEPEWRDAPPDVESMLASSDAALLIGDPALAISAGSDPGIRTFDLAELWHRHTGFGFIFAMWMTRAEKCPIDLAGARDEGLDHITAIAANYASDTGLSSDEMIGYLTENISFKVDETMQAGLDLYLKLAYRHKLIARPASLRYTGGGPGV